jgi:type IV pilus assembly protein PilA
MVEYRQLVGATNYIKSIQTVAGETYPAFYTRGITITVTGIAGVRTITYAP